MVLLICKFKCFQPQAYQATQPVVRPLQTDRVFSNDILVQRKNLQQFNFSYHHLVQT